MLVFVGAPVTIVRCVGDCLSVSFCVGICEAICVLVCVWLAWNARLKIIYQDIILFICYYIDKIILFFVRYGCKNIGFIC